MLRAAGRCGRFLSSRSSCSSLKHSIGLEEQESVQWAKSPEGAAFLQALSSNFPSHGGHKDFESFMRACNVEAPNPAGMRMVSALLSFPLTLSLAVNIIFPELQRLKVALVGARADSTLPLQWWARSVLNSIHLQDLSLRSFGPEAGSRFPYVDNKYEMSLVIDHLSQSKRVSMYCDRNSQCPLHLHSNLHQTLFENDVFVLFNPGLGSPYLKASWKPTLLSLLESRKPIICTAYSDLDLRRDMSTWSELSQELNDQELQEPLEVLISPQSNPFASQRKVFGALEDKEGQVVLTNQYLYALIAK